MIDFSVLLKFLNGVWRPIFDYAFVDFWLFLNIKPNFYNFALVNAQHAVSDVYYMQ